MQIAKGTSPPTRAQSSFDQRVYAVVAQIPRGQLATYGQIAELIGAYGAARQVGWALRRLPLPSTIPWQRLDPTRAAACRRHPRRRCRPPAPGPPPLARHRWPATAGAPRLSL